MAPLLLAWGFRDRIARRRDADGRYRLASGAGAALAPDDALSAQEWLIAPGLLQLSQSPDARIRLALPLDIARLAAARPAWFSRTTAMQWDEDKGSLRVVQRERLGQLVLREQPQARPSDAVMAQAMLDWISEQGLGVLTWEREAVQLRQRLLPSLSGIRDARGFARVNLAEALLRLLDWPLR